MCILEGINRKLHSPDALERVIADFCGNLAEVTFIQIEGEWAVKFEQEIPIDLLRRFCQIYPIYYDHPAIAELGDLIYPLAEDELTSEMYALDLEQEGMEQEEDEPELVQLILNDDDFHENEEQVVPNLPETPPGTPPVSDEGYYSDVSSVEY